MNYPFKCRKTSLFNSEDKNKQTKWMDEERLGEREAKWGQIKYTPQEPEKMSLNHILGTITYTVISLSDWQFWFRINYSYHYGQSLS